MSIFTNAGAYCRVIATAITVLLVTALLPASPAASSTAIGSGFFGMHDFNPVGTGATQWPNAPVGSIRAWATGTAWRDIEKSPGVFDFSTLDAIVATARSRGSDVLLVLGQTPAFHAVNPSVRGFMGTGASSVPRLPAWSRYVAKVGARYKGQRVRYQVWNEPNVSGFWTGTPAQMARLTQTADKALRAVDAGAVLVGPSFVTRLSSQRVWMDRFYAQRPAVAGYDYPVARYVDAVAVQLYPASTGTPESAIALLKLDRAILAKRGVTKPLWNTEVNYGAINWVTPAIPISSARQAAYVARTYILNAANGIKRVYWYAWDLHHGANTSLTRLDNTTLTPAGIAFRVTRSWMVGARLDFCSRNSLGTYTCLISYAYGKKRIYWNPSRTVYVKSVGSATWWQGLDGVKHTVAGGKTLRIGMSPILVRSNR